MLLKDFLENRNPQVAFTLLNTYPNAVFVDELRIELAGELVNRNRLKSARAVLRPVKLSSVRDRYAPKVVNLWKALKLDPKPLVLRFPEYAVESIDGLKFSPRERERILKRLLFRKKYKALIKLNLSTCFYRGVAFFKLKRYNDALSSLRACKDDRAPKYLLYTYMRIGDKKSIYDLLAKEKNPSLHFIYGWSLLGKGRYKEAKAQFLKAGDSFRPVFYAGVVDYIYGNFKSAYNFFSRAQELASEPFQKARAYFWKAKTLTSLGRSDEARTYLEKASRFEGFYGAVARKLLERPVYTDDAEGQKYTGETPFLSRLKAIHRLGFLYYMRKEALRKKNHMNEADIIGLLDIDPFLAIRLAVTKFGIGSDIYRRIAFPTPFEKYVYEASKRFDIEPALIYAVMRQESLFDTEAVSISGAKGLMQLMDFTARWISKKVGYAYSDIFDPRSNIFLGTAYLSFLMDFWNKDIVRVVASYNAGQGAVSRWRKYEDDFLFIETIPYNETRKYVRRVLWFYYVYREILSRGKRK